jgi:hypothetical protein
MQLTKQQKIVGALLVLAIGAFLVDRFVIGDDADDGALTSAGQARAAGASARRPAAPRAPGLAAVAAAPVPQAPDAAFGNAAGLAARLEYLRMRSDAAGQPMNLSAVRDAFRPPAALVSARKVETVDELQDSARRFADRHKLAAIVRRQSGAGVAIIEDRSGVSGQSLTVAVGQSLDGFTLVAVKDRLAILRRGTQRVELRLQDDANQPTITPSEKIAGIDSNR